MINFFIAFRTHEGSTLGREGTFHNILLCCLQLRCHSCDGTDDCSRKSSPKFATGTWTGCWKSVHRIFHDFSWHGRFVYGANSVRLKWWNKESEWWFLSGFSISIMKADEVILKHLDATTKAPHWPVGVDGQWYVMIVYSFCVLVFISVNKDIMCETSLMANWFICFTVIKFIYQGI